MLEQYHDFPPCRVGVRRLPTPHRTRVATASRSLCSAHPLRRGGWAKHGGNLVTDACNRPRSAVVTDALARAQTRRQHRLTLYFGLALPISIALAAFAVVPACLPLTARQVHVLDTLAERVAERKREPVSRVWGELALRFGVPTKIPRARFDEVASALAEQLDGRGAR